MAKRWKKKKRVLTGFISLLLLTFTILTSVAESGKLPFDFPSWSSLGQSVGIDNLELEKYPVQINTVDVGNADFIYIRANDKNVVIDAGDIATKDKVVAYLRRQGVQKIDYLIATHPHADHIGGMPEIIKNFDIGEIIAPKMNAKILPTTDIYKEFLTAVKDKNQTITAPVLGRAIEFGDCTLKILAPFGEDQSEINNTSIVTKFTYKDVSALLMGDAEADVERKIIKEYPAESLKADIFKVGHHGSSTSNTPELLEIVGAKYYIIPCGKGNKYNHPHADVLKRLKSFGGQIYRSDYNKNVIFKTDGKEIKVDNEK